MQVVLPYKIKTSIDQGISFLKTNQLVSGEFPTYISDNADMTNPRYVKTISMTIAVPCCLKSFENFYDIRPIVDASIRFILNERENGMVWKFFGKNSAIIPDLEDTCGALALLKDNNVDLEYENFAERMLAIRNNEGVFYTWFSEKGPENNIDWVTNTNVLYFYFLLGRTIPEVCIYLKRIIKEKRFIEGSHYYRSPYSFTYFFTRLYSRFNISDFHESIDLLIEFLLSTRVLRGWGDQFNKILATASLINAGYSDRTILDEAVRQVIDQQDKDGGWPIGSIFNHRSVGLFYGSRELSTALAIETLIRYGKGRLWFS